MEKYLHDTYSMRREGGRSDRTLKSKYLKFRFYLLSDGSSIMKRNTVSS